MGAIVTSTVTVPALVVEIPLGGASATFWVTSWVAPATDTGAVSTWMSAVSCSASPSTVTRRGVDGDARDPEAGRGRAGDDRVDREGPRFLVGEQGDLDVDGGRLDVDPRDLLPVCVDRVGLDLAVHVEALRIERHEHLRGDDPRDRRGRPAHRHGLRLVGRLADLDPLGRRTALDAHRDVLR